MKHNLVDHIRYAAETKGIRLGLLIALLGLAGCGSARPIKYYELTAPVGGSSASDSINVSISVRTFAASHLLREDRIAYGWNAQQVATYQSQRWTSPPVELLEDAIVRGLRASGRFRSVATVRGANTGEFVISGQLYDFKEVDGGTIVARLAFDAQLFDRKTGTTVWKTSYVRDEPCASKDVPSVVAAMDRNVHQSVRQLQAGLEEYFRAHPIN